MRRGSVLVLAPLCGCAAIIGASFDDASLAPADAGDEVIVFSEGSTDVQKPTFDPKTITGLEFWIDASRSVDAANGTSGPVTRWHDLSTFARDALPSSSGMTNAPTLVPNSINGLPVVHFASSNLELLQSSFTGPGTPNLTIFVVVRGYSISAIRFQSAAGTYPFLLFPYDINIDASSPSYALLVGIPAQTYTTIHARLDGGVSLAGFEWNASGTATTYDDGTIVEQRVALDPTMPGGQTLFIGGVLPLLASPNTQIPFMNGDLAEALIYGAALTNTDRAAVEAYLRVKWGIFP